MKDRKAFNFYRSYYDVAQELPDQDRLEFLWSVIHAQFTGEIIEPESKLAKLVFVGIRHSIEKQLQGYQHGLKTPSKGTCKAPRKEPLPQEQEQVQEQEKDNIETVFLHWFNRRKEKHTGKAGKFRVLTGTDLNNLKKLKKGYTPEEFNQAAEAMFQKGSWAMQNQKADPSHFLRVENFNKYLNTEVKKKTETTYNPNF